MNLPALLYLYCLKNKITKIDRLFIIINNDNDTGDSCFCGRIGFSCCASKDKCTGTHLQILNTFELYRVYLKCIYFKLCNKYTRSCSQTVNGLKCDNEVNKGLEYW